METNHLTKKLLASLTIVCITCLPVAGPVKGNDLEPKKSSRHRFKEKKQVKEKKQMKKLELESPDKQHIVIFSKPTPGYEDNDMAYWRKVELLDKNSDNINVIEDATISDQSDSIAFEPLDEKDIRWSPDGRFFVMFHYQKIEPQPVKEEKKYLDVCLGEYLMFKSKDRKFLATSDRFSGWKDGEPHTMIILGRGQDYLDAYPDLTGELPPCD
ncbi:hypothetical protein [Geobacter sp.]|uniref:hypothetical protein n=1 Tax=Geobacter sp. TaxID=46610 RepID=UPI0027B9C6B8|nr:hypothetical protein [Geobacter sp.]